jgi:hypothetical protein
MANHQVMMHAPIELRENYFQEMYKSITLETISCLMSKEVKKMKLEAKKRQFETLIMSVDDPIMVSEGYNVAATEGTHVDNDNHEVLHEEQSC